MLISGIKTVIYDLDGTIINSGKIGFNRLVAIAKRNGFDFTKEADNQLRLLWGHSPLLLVMNGLSVDETTATSFLSEWRDWDAREPIPLVEGVVDVLKRNAENGILNVLFTAREKESAIRVLERYKIKDLFLDIVGSNGGIRVEASGFEKPDPRALIPLIKYLAEKHNIERSGMAYVGDELFDIYCAMGAGIRMLAVETGIKTRADFIRESGIPEDDIFTSATELNFIANTLKPAK